MPSPLSAARERLELDRKSGKDIPTAKSKSDEAIFTQELDSFEFYVQTYSQVYTAYGLHTLRFSEGHSWQRVHNSDAAKSHAPWQAVQTLSVLPDHLPVVVEDTGRKIKRHLVSTIKRHLVSTIKRHLVSTPNLIEKTHKFSML